MLDFAFGELALKPDEFWQLTWGEYYRMMRGYNRRFEKERMSMATILAAVYNTIPRKPGRPSYSPDDFIPREKKEIEELTIEERRARMEEALIHTERFNNGGVVYSGFRNVDMLKHGR